MAASNDWADERVAALPIAQGRAELLEEIMSTSADDLNDLTDTAAPRDGRRRWAVPVAAAAAVAVLAVLVSIPFWGSDGESTRPLEPLTTSALPAPAALTQLVLEDAAWTVEDISTDPEEQEVSYGDGDELGVDVKQIPAGALTLDQIAADHRDITDPPSAGVDVEVAGLAGRLWSYSGRDHLVATEVGDGYRFEVRAQGMTLAELRVLLTSFSLVDQAGFEEALPEEFVLPSERETAIAEIMQGLLLNSGAGMPGGLPVPTTDEIDPLGVGDDIAGGFACAWFDVYVTGTRDGDDAAVAQAQGVLATATRWPALIAENRAGGGYADVVWEFADRASDGKPVRPALLDQALGCSER